MKNLPTDPKLYELVKEKVKKQFTVWPSAYASGQLVKQYKEAFAQKWGNQQPYSPTGSSNRSKDTHIPDLERWFKEKWVNVCDNNKPCGRNKAKLSSNDYPYCRPLYRISDKTPRTVSEFTTEELEEMCAIKHSKKQGVSGKPTRIYEKKQLGGSSSPLIVRNLTDAERSQSSKHYKKWAVDLPSGKTVYFGDNRYEDFTIHKDPNRMENYLTRHQKREDWTVDAITKPGFWSRWLLWNLPSFTQSLKDIENRFGIKIINQTHR